MMHFNLAHSPRELEPRRLLERRQLRQLKLSLREEKERSNGDGKINP